MEWILISLGLLVLGGGVVWWVRRANTKKLSGKAPAPIAFDSTPQRSEVKSDEAGAVSSLPASAAAPALSLSDRLVKTRSFLGKKLERFFSAGELQSQQWEELEEVLLEADVGFSTTQRLIEKSKERIRTQSESDLKKVLRDECLTLFNGSVATSLDFSAAKPYVISIVGVNGVGKTTTIGKLAQKFKKEGKTVLMGAADTFRAAAIQQLKVWADRVEADFVSGREGGDPGAVAFDALSAAKARQIDVVLLDSAGRLHTKAGLMDELKKVDRVMKKVIPEAPHQTWLVLDGTLGQNSVAQAKEFKKALELNGVIITKLDGTAKGGALLAIAAELGLSVRYIGVGESADDFLPFDSENFVDAILS